MKANKKIYLASKIGSDKRIHGIVSGRVQGVFFRIFTQKCAKELLLKGWVKNTPDGSVEFIAEGNEFALIEFIEKIRKGSTASIVEKLDVSWSKTENEFKEFRIIY